LRWSECVWQSGENRCLALCVIGFKFVFLPANYRGPSCLGLTLNTQAVEGAGRGRMIKGKEFLIGIDVRCEHLSSLHAMTPTPPRNSTYLEIRRFIPTYKVLISLDVCVFFHFPVQISDCEKAYHVVTPLSEVQVSSICGFGTKLRMSPQQAKRVRGGNVAQVKQEQETLIWHDFSAARCPFSPCARILGWGSSRTGSRVTQMK